ncbi:MAG: flavodoxin family protein [Candidatus Micrarchaeota archaeon]
MKTLLLYMSVHHGNTEKIANMMGEQLNASVRKITEVTAADLEKYDLIGFGSGIYGMRHHLAILNFVNGLPDSKELKQKAFIFSTSGAGLIHYHRPLRGRLYAKGFEVVGDFSCKGFDTFGPLKLLGGINKDRPNEADFFRARTFAESLKSL